MKENNKEISPPTTDDKTAKSKEEKIRKPFSPEEIEKRKKMLIYPLMVLIFLGAMYLIFAPSKAEKKEQEIGQGLNLEIPQVSGGELPDDKETAYKQADIEQNESERQSAIGTLSDFFGSTQRANNRTEEWELVAEPVYDNQGSRNEIHQSASAYSDIRHTLGSFYEDNSQTEALQAQIDALQAQLEEKSNAEKEDDEMQKQLELMEKSYAIAAKYMPNTSASLSNTIGMTAEPSKESTPKTQVTTREKEPVFTVLPEITNVVSALYREVPDSVFVKEQMQERNHNFLSAADDIDNYLFDKNTLKVSVHETVTLKDGETVRLRLLEAARVAGILIPKNKLLTAQAKIQGNRLSLTVTNIEQQGRIIAVNLLAHDNDGQPGIFIPNSEEMNAVKEVAAGMGQSAGTSFTLNSSAGQQLAADAGKGLMQGASQYLNKKMREVKVTLKSGHILFLMQEQ